VGRYKKGGSLVHGFHSTLSAALIKWLVIVKDDTLAGGTTRVSRGRWEGSKEGTGEALGYGKEGGGGF